MYTSISSILEDAARNQYAVIATSPINMETARGMVAAATEKHAPLIFLLGQNMMRQHAKAELMIPMIKTLAEHSPVPIATCLDHGNDEERILYSFRNGFSSIMFDGSLFGFEQNVQQTKKVVDMCHTFGMGVEGELGHVGMAHTGDQQDERLYTDPTDAKVFVERTGVDCLAIAVGTAHGEYPTGIIPHINFPRIRAIKDITGGIPIALHGGSGSGDENIIKAVEAGINKINVVTDVFVACRNTAARVLTETPAISFIDLQIAIEKCARDLLIHWIGLSGSAGKAEHFRPENSFGRLSEMHRIGMQE